MKRNLTKKEGKVLGHLTCKIMVILNKTRTNKITVGTKNFHCWTKKLSLREEK